MKLFSGKRLKLVFSSLLSVLVFGSLWTCSISASDDSLGTPDTPRVATGVTFIEDFDLEFTVTGGLLQSIHIDTPNFTVTDGTNNGYHINAGNIKLKTDNGLITNYANVSIVPNSANIWTVEANGVDVNGNDITYSAQVENLHCSYKLVQRLYIGYNMPVKGYVYFNATLRSGKVLHNVRVVPGHGGIYYTGTGSSSDPFKFQFYNIGQTEFMCDFIMNVYNSTSLPSVWNDAILNWDWNTYDISHLEPYEEPVKDVESHNLLQRILDAILNTNDNGAAQQQVNEIKDTAENKMGGVTEATELFEQGFENLQGEAVNKLTFPGLFGGSSWSLDLGYIEQQAPELVAIMRTLLIAAVAWGCYEMLKNTVLGNRV